MRDQLLRVHIWLVATLFPLIVRFVPIRGLLWLAERPRHWTPYRGLPPERVLTLVQTRLRNPRNMRRRRCLRHGVMLYHFLRLAGIPAEMRFGVLGPATTGKRLHAHCWVTLQGREIDPPTAPVAVVLTRVYQPVPA
jgi:hypothetical protein